MLTKHTWKANISFVFALSCTLLILFLSLANIGKVQIIQIEASDKVYHLAAYFILSSCWFLFFYFKKKIFSNYLKVYIIVALIIFGIIIEALQFSLTTYRTFDWWDALANSLGIFLAYFIFFKVEVFINKK